MIGVSKLLEWSRIDSSLTIKGKIYLLSLQLQIKLCSNVTCKTGINKILNIILCNNLKKLINIFKQYQLFVFYIYLFI